MIALKILAIVAAATVVISISTSKHIKLLNKAEMPERVHIVEKGETLFDIAKKEHVTVKEILDANHMTADEIIYPNDWLLIPLEKIDEQTNGDVI